MYVERQTDRQANKQTDRQTHMLPTNVTGYISNIRLYKNGQYTRRTVVRRELGRIRANSSELGRTPRELANGSPTPTPRRTAANVRRSTPNVRRSSPRFDRVRPYSAANWRTVRQKIRSLEEIQPPLTSVRRERVRRELRSLMANCSSPKSIFWMG